MSGTIGTAYIQIAPNMSGVQGKISAGLRGSGSQFAEQFGGEISGRSAIVIGAIAGVAQAGVTKAMSLVTESISGAVKRVDTLNAAQKTFQYMGFAASDASAATKAVTASILGLPTPLDSAIRGMTSLAATYQDVKLGQRVFSALNDAILGFGGSTDMVDNAIQQLSQLPLDGPLDAQTWNSLRNSGLTPVLVAMGKDMGLSVSQLKENLGSGKLTVRDFTNELMKLDTQGGGGLTSLHKIALNATSGIGTGFANMKTAVTRGLASIIDAIGQKNISDAVTKIGKVFEQVLNSIAKAIPVAIGYVKELFGFIARNKDIFSALAVGVAAATAAMIGLAIASKVAAGIAAMTRAIQAAQIAMATYTALTQSGTGAMVAFEAVTGANPFAILIVAIAAVGAALIYFFTKTETGRRIFAAFTDFLAGVWDKVKAAIKTVADFLGTAWDASVGLVKTAFNDIKNTAQAVFNAIAGFIEDHKKGLTDIAIIITAIVLPKLIALGIQAAIAAAQAVAAFAVMAAGAVANAAISTAAWVVSAAQSVAAFVVRIPAMIAQFVLASAAAVVNAAIATAAWVAGAAQTIARWVVAFAIYAAGVAASAAATLLAGAQMALAWLLALGPIGIVIAVVAAAVALIIANWAAVKSFVVGVWQGIQNAVSAVIGWISANWPLLLAIITGPIGLAVLYVTRHWDSIKQGAANAIGAVISFFSGLPGRVLSAVGNLGSTLYNAGKDLIQGLLNGAGSLLAKIGSFFLDKVPGWIKGPFKKALGISSPSKVFAAYGGDITQGLINGIADSAGGVTKAVKSMTSAALGGMADNGLTLNYATHAAQIGAPSPAVGANSAAQNTGPAVVQNNNVYNQVDFTKVVNDMTWELNRIG